MTMNVLNKTLCQSYLCSPMVKFTKNISKSAACAGFAVNTTYNGMLSGQLFGCQYCKGVTPPSTHSAIKRYLTSQSVDESKQLLPRSRRAFLYVPGDSEKMIKKASKLKVDSVCLDMEDGVASSSKDLARETIVKCLDSIKFVDKVDVCVRTNSISSGLAEKELEALFKVENTPSSICVPKVEEPAEIEWLLNRLYGLSQERANNHKLHIVLICETPKGLVNLKEICKELNDLSTMLKSNLVPDAIVFGSDDYCAAVGATRTEASTEVLYARQKILMISKLFNLQAIDMVYNDLGNEEGLKNSCIQGKLMGYNGKQIINPKQIETVQNCFSPSESEILWAKELISEWEAKSQDGVGAISFKGKMIDAPLVTQARNIVRMKEKMDCFT